MSVCLCTLELHGKHTIASVFPFFEVSLQCQHITWHRRVGTCILELVAVNGAFKLQVPRAEQDVAATANPYGSIGCTAGGKNTGSSCANKTKVLGATSKNTTSHPDAPDTEAGKNNMPSSHVLSDKHNISYRTSQSIVRMPGCALSQDDRMLFSAVPLAITTVGVTMQVCCGLSTFPE